MKRLRLLGLALMAVFALGAVAAASASATERGVLLLEPETGSVTFTGTTTAGVSATLALGANTIICLGISLLNAKLEVPGPKHFNLGKGAEIHFSSCKSKTAACSSENLKAEKDPKEVILLLAAMHMVNLLNASKELTPGLAVLVLGTPSDGTAAGGVEILKINCGAVLKLEVKGAAIGLVTPLFEEKVTLTKEVTDLDLRFAAKSTDTCDTEGGEKVCGEIQTNEPLLSKVAEKFEPATEETTLFLITSNKPITVDD